MNGNEYRCHMFTSKEITCHIKLPYLKISAGIIIMNSCYYMLSWYHRSIIYDHCYLVGGWPTPLKNTSSSVGLIIPFPTEWKVIKFIFETTNQLKSIYTILYLLWFINQQKCGLSPPFRISSDSWVKLSHSPPPGDGLKNCAVSFKPKTKGCPAVTGPSPVEVHHGWEIPWFSSKQKGPSSSCKWLVDFQWFSWRFSPSLNNQTPSHLFQ
jgi:hypothetical protein